MFAVPCQSSRRGPFSLLSSLVSGSGRTIYQPREPLAPKLRKAAPELVVPKWHLVEVMSNHSVYVQMVDQRSLSSHGLLLDLVGGY